MSNIFKNQYFKFNNYLLILRFDTECPIQILYNTTMKMSSFREISVYKFDGNFRNYKI